MKPYADEVMVGKLFWSQRPKCVTIVAYLQLVEFMILQELAADLKQELSEKLMDLDVAKFCMYPVKVCLLGYGAVQLCSVL